MKKEVNENHEKYLERIALYRKFDYDIDQERNFIIDNARPFSGNILEAGTGKGYFTLALARAGFNFFSFDISAAEQRYALLNLMYYELQDQVTFVIANIESIPCDDSFFDTIFTVNMIHHLSSVRKVCDEFIRILTRTGKIILSDFNKQGLKILDKVHAFEGKQHEFSGGSIIEAKIILKEYGFKIDEYQSANQDVLVATRT